MKLILKETQVKFILDNLIDDKINESKVEEVNQDNNKEIKEKE